MLYSKTFHEALNGFSIRIQHVNATFKRLTILASSMFLFLAKIVYYYIDSTNKYMC